jgi:hypothetical protein
MAYMHIPNLYKQQTIMLFKEAYAMEKIHGCVQGKTKINLFDGTKKEISKIVVDDYVMGMNNDGAIIPSKVTQIFHNGINNVWYEVSGTRFAAGRGGNGHFMIKCTGEHKFYSPEKNDYIKVSDLKEDDNVYCLKSDKSLTYLQKQVLLGIMLGDGTFYQNSISGKIEWVHKKNSIEYMDYISQILGYIVNPNRRDGVSGYGSKTLRQETFSNYYIKDYFTSFIKGGRKIVPNWVEAELTPISIAFWYMDDGTLLHDEGQRDRVSFATCGFTKKDCDVLVKGLKKLGIESQIKKYSDGYNRIVVDADNSIKLFLLISPYVSESMKYKIPLEYRKITSSIFPTEKNEYSHEITLQTITKIKKRRLEIGLMKHDIETETNNYFANDILVHNSSAHIGWKFETKQVRFFTGENHELFLSLFDKNFLIKKFEEIFPDQDVVIFGEHYGGKCQGMSHTYGKVSKFIGFDVKVGNVWLNVPNAEDVCDNFNIEFVHYDKIEVNLDNLNKYRDNPSVQAYRNGCGNDKKREGIVLRPFIEMRTNNGERVICKYKPDEEMETKTKREVSPEQLKILSDAKEIAEEWTTNKRLEHVLQKFPADVGMESMGDIIKAMIEDIYREGKDEIVESKAVGKAIGKQTVTLFKQKLQNKLK